MSIECMMIKYGGEKEESPEVQEQISKEQYRGKEGGKGWK